MRFNLNVKYISNISHYILSEQNLCRIGNPIRIEFDLADAIDLRYFRRR